MNRLVTVATGLLIVLGGAAISTGAIAQNRLTIATGGAAGVYHPLGNAMAKVLGSYLPDTTAGNEATSASADNIRRIVAGSVQVAFTQADTAWDAFKGYGAFQNAGPQPIRTIAVLYPNSLQLVTTANSGINKVSDLRGKRVSTGAKGSGTEIWGYRLLEASGIDPKKDINDIKLGIGPSAADLKSGKLDALVWSGGIPTKAIADLANDPTVQVKLVNTAAAVISMLRKYGPVYTDGEIVANAYKGVSRDTPVAQVWNLLVVRADADEKLVYDIVKTLFDHKPELIAGHKAATEMELRTQARGGSPIPFHNGAKKFYRENGVRILR